MTDELHFDKESASDVDLTKVGLDVYSAHPSTRVLMVAYKFNNNPMQHWEAHKRRIPAELKEAIEDPAVVKWAFNAQFERVMAKRVLGLKVVRKNWRCSMTLAYMHSFMGGLEQVGDQCGLPRQYQKGKEGKDLIKLFTKPQRITKNQPHLWRNWITDPEQWETFCEYNKQDVVAEDALLTRLRSYPVPDIEWDFYELDQKINDRGIPADIEFIQNVIWMSNRRKAELVKQMQEITGCDNPNSTQQLLPWLHDNGYRQDNLRKESVKKQLEQDIGEVDSPVKEDDEPLIKVLKYRQWAARTSTSKAVTALRTMGEGNRLRYLYKFAGASRTNRFSGQNTQPQNLMVTPKLIDPEEDAAEKLTTITNMIREGDYDAFGLMIDEPMRAFTGTMRSMFRVEDNEQTEFQVADLKSIESAVIAWVTQCPRLLGVFNDGKDPYKDFGTEFYKKAYDDITRAERGICKPPALGCGFRLSGGQILSDGTKTGLLAYAENMGVKMTAKEAEHAVTVYRTMYPEIPDFWKDCEKAIRIVLTSKKDYKLGFLTFKWRKPYLLIELPSGRHIYYYKPRLEKRTITTNRMRKIKVRNHIDKQTYLDFGFGLDDIIDEPETYVRQTFTYMGKNQRTQQWTRLDGHGGVTTENVVQAIARDVLREKLMRMDEESFNIVMHSHDEGGAIGRKGANRLNLELMLDIFKEPISWAPGLPLGASGWAGPFYRK